MVYFLPPRPNIGRDITQGISKGLSSVLDERQQQQQNQQLQQALGNISQQPQNLNDEQKFLRFAQQTQGHPQQENLIKFYLQSLKQSAANVPEAQQQNPAVKALQEVESLIGQEGIGFLGKLNPSDKARFNRGKFQSLQAAVLPLFKQMFPRGMTEKEFKFIQQNYIPQTSDTEETIKGKIAGLRQLLGDQSGQPMQGQQQPQQQVSATLKVYDKSGKVVGTISAEEANQLPQGYTAK